MVGSVRRRAVLFSIIALLMSSPTWAGSASHALTLKGGQYHWADRTQETARTDVEYEPGSGVLVVAFERRSQYVSLGAEIMHMTSDWDAIDPAATHQKGRLELDAISFVPRKYFAPIGEFVPFIGFGVGLARVNSIYSVGLASDSQDEDGIIYQLNLGGEWRWESTGLMFELKRTHLQIDDFTLAPDKDDFPEISGTTGLIGISFIF